MNINYVKKYSNALGRDMEYKTYGDKGHPVLVFPSQNGRFYDYQDFDMVGVLSSFIDRGFIRLICVDSIDGETWSDMQGDHHRRIALHEQWFHYIIDELIPELRHHPEETFIVTGCSMGGFHAANFFFRRPDLFDTLLALSGLYYAGYFFPNYRDPLIYDNSPYDFLRSMPADHHYWDIYRHRSIVMCVGQGAWEDDLLESTRQMDALLREKNVPAWIDYWGHDVAHDWAWWRKQIVYFMDHLLAEKTVEYAIITYETRYMQDFIRLNKQWIETWFRLEQSDLDTFAHIDDNIIGHGGQIFLAIDESGQVVGCCALKPHPESDCHELAKMAVSPDVQGKGIGRKLGEALLEYARSHDVKRIFLEGNTRLEASIALYRKLGFKEIPLKNNAYERCDILMEIFL